MRRGITAEIDLDAALNNLDAVRKAVKGLPVIAVVKADAYGHGAAELARLYEDAEVHALAVAFVSEAEELRASGIKAPMLVLFDNTEPDKYIELGLTPVIHDLKAARAFSQVAEKSGRPLDVHLKVDTGMGRVGLTNERDFVEVLNIKGLNVIGLMSHFSDADLTDADFIDVQLGRFKEFKALSRKKKLSPLCHMANSAASLAYPEAHMDAVRPGLALYGVSPFEEGGPFSTSLRPIMTAKARIVTIRKLAAGQPVSYGRTFITARPTLAAVIAAGYADGLGRMLSNNADVLIKGKRAPVMGRVCMDIVMADVTEAGNVSEEDEAVLLGRGGDEEITAWELAGRASTFPNEILLYLGRNARRVYSRIPLPGEHQV
ncbi:MAG: alanine racemase [Nitrospirota bacterium]